MANAPIGDNFFEGELGVVRIEFNDILMGKTTEDTEIQWIEDIQDIFFQQDGSQPADKIPTGQAYMVTCTFGEITLARLQQLMRGFTPTGNSVALTRDLYRSAKTNFSKKLVLKRVDSDGDSWTNTHFWLTFYAAFPMVTGNFQWGATTQRNIQVQFYIFRDDTNKAFGYVGNATSAGLLPAA
jgi:hypothetical protein